MPAHHKLNVKTYFYNRDIGLYLNKQDCRKLSSFGAKSDEEFVTRIVGASTDLEEEKIGIIPNKGGFTDFLTRSHEIVSSFTLDDFFVYETDIYLGNIFSFTSDREKLFYNQNSVFYVLDLSTLKKSTSPENVPVGVYGTHF
jgi:hypothetical protein